MEIDIATVRAAIDFTAEQGGGVVGIEYVKADGSIRQMRIRKVRGSGTQPGEKVAFTKRTRSKAFLRVMDLDDGLAKTLFFFSIIGFSPDGSSTFHPVVHGVSRS